MVLHYLTFKFSTLSETFIFGHMEHASTALQFSLHLLTLTTTE